MQQSAIHAAKPQEAALLLREKGCCTFPFGLVYQAAITDIVESFLKLTKLPIEEQRKWFVDGISDFNGFRKYEARGYTKYSFNYRGRKHIVPILKQHGVSTKEWRNFLLKLDLVYYELLSKMNTMTSLLAKHLPYSKLAERISRSRSRGVLKLRYFPPGNDRDDGPAYDDSLFTVHVADYPHGVMIGRRNGEFGDVYRSHEGNVLIFAGMKAQIASNIECQYHGDKSALEDGWWQKYSVIPSFYNIGLATPKAVANGRWSITFAYDCFVDIPQQELKDLCKKMMNNYLNQFEIAI